jgi:phospholipase/carboxylesterase
MKHVYEQGSNGKTLIMLHGTGGDEYDLIPLAKHIDPHANILSIRGNVQEYGMPRFFKRLAMGVFDMESLSEETENLYNFIHESAINYGFELSLATVIGYSNGANIAASILLTYDAVFGKAILFRPMVPRRDQDITNLNQVRIVMYAGKHDQTVPEYDPDTLKGFFETRHAMVDLVWLNEGHQLTRDELEQAKTWYHEHA